MQIIVEMDEVPILSKSDDENSLLDKVVNKFFSSTSNLNPALKMGSKM
jgi:hypothetical protein